MFNQEEDRLAQAAAPAKCACCGAQRLMERRDFVVATPIAAGRTWPEVHELRIAPVVCLDCGLVHLFDLPTLERLVKRIEARRGTKLPHERTRRQGKRTGARRQ